MTLLVLLTLFTRWSLQSIHALIIFVTFAFAAFVTHPFILPPINCQPGAVRQCSECGRYGSKWHQYLSTRIHVAKVYFSLSNRLLELALPLTTDLKMELKSARKGGCSIGTRETKLQITLWKKQVVSHVREWGDRRWGVWGEFGGVPVNVKCSTAGPQGRCRGRQAKTVRREGNGFWVWSDNISVHAAIAQQGRMAWSPSNGVKSELRYWLTCAFCASF